MQIFYDSSTEPAPVVIDGAPPVDQSAEVAALQAQVAQITSERDAAQAQATALQAKIDAAKAALA